MTGAVMAALLAAVSLQTADDFVWHAYPDNQIQYGVPDTDLRAAGFGCGEDGGLWISVAGPEQPNLVLQGRLYPGAFVERGDGMNVVAPLTADSAPVRAILADEPMTVGVGADAMALPGGGGRLMADLISRCARRR